MIAIAPRGRRPRRRGSASPRAGRTPRRPGSSARRASDRARSRRAAAPKPLPSRSRAITPSSASASTLLPSVSLTIARPDEQRHAVAEQRRERAREPRDLDLDHEVADERQRAGSAHPSAPRTTGSRSRRRIQRTARTTSAAIAHHHCLTPVPRKITTCVGSGSALPGLRERLLELRHDPDQQHHHRQHGDADQDRRIDERRLHALAQLLVALHRVGEARQHDAERAARLARADDVDVEAREHVAPRVERLRQRLAAAHVVADLLQQRRDRRRVGEADQDLERAVERQPGAQQRRELARDREQLVAGDAISTRTTGAARSAPRRRPRRAPAAPPPAARATCIGIRPWSRSRSTISASFAASSSPVATSPAGV